MKEPIEISELNKWLSDLPEVIKYKDGDAIVDCRLSFYFHKGNKTEKSSWTVAYHCVEYNYFLMCGHGETLVKAVNHLRRVLKDYRRYRDDGYVRQ